MMDVIFEQLKRSTSFNHQIRLLQWSLQQRCKWASSWSLSGPSPTITFETRFRPESQIYQVSQEMSNCGVLVVYHSEHD